MWGGHLIKLSARGAPNGFEIDAAPLPSSARLEADNAEHSSRGLRSAEGEALDRAVVRRAYYLRWTTTQIADDLCIEECTVKSRLHFALRALRLILQRRLTRCTLGASRRQRLRNGVVPVLQALLVGAFDGDREGAGRRSPGASDIREQ